MYSQLTSFGDSVKQIWYDFLGYVPSIIYAIIILVIGMLIGAAIGTLVKKLMSYTRIDHLMERTQVKENAQKMGFSYTISGLIGDIVKWIIYLITFMTAAEILQIPIITDFLRTIVYYIPNVIVAVIILVIGLALGRVIYKLIAETAGISKSLPNQLLGKIAEWAIVIFAILAALVQLEIASSLIQIAFTAFALTLAIALGLSFGLGGRDKAKELIDKVSK